MLPLGVQPVLGNLVMFFQPTVQNPLVGPKTILYGMVFSHCSKGGIQESQKLVTIEPWTEGISQASTSYTVLNSWVKLFTGVKALGSTGDSGGPCRTCLRAERKLEAEQGLGLPARPTVLFLRNAMLFPVPSIPTQQL